MGNDAADIFRNLVTPALLIAAGGLLALSTSSRLMAILERLRALQRERAELLARPPDRGRTERHVRSLRLDGLRSQMSVMLVSARWMRFTLIALFVSILSMLVCFAFIGAASLSQRFFAGAVVCFGLGVIAFATGVVASIIEVSRPLQAAAEDHGCAGTVGLDDSVEATA